MDHETLTSAIKQQARQLGFDLVGVCRAEPPQDVERLRQWLAAGYAGQMQYLPRRAAAYEHPRHVLDGARSIVMVAMNYRTADPVPPDDCQGQISCYAWGPADYHDVIRQRLDELAGFVRNKVPGAAVRGVVDTAPLLERPMARAAGLGWVGKNTLLLNRQLGSWFFLGALLTDIELVPDPPFPTDHCGSCTACLDACPTHAFPQPYVLDARRCISYLTIELRGPIPQPLRPQIGQWLFGCDICQQVCPWNRRAPTSLVPAFQPRRDTNPAELLELFDLDEQQFRQRFRQTPLWRSRRRGLLRNAAIVLGNRPSPRAVDALVRGLHDVDPVVRGACAWALGRQAGSKANRALQRRLAEEPDPDVRREISDALRHHSPSP